MQELWDNHEYEHIILLGNLGRVGGVGWRMTFHQYNTGNEL
jgi:hypothetical protein